MTNMDEAQRAMLDAYLGRIATFYESTPENQRLNLFGNLERFIGGLEDGNIEVGEVTKIFDPKKARAIRETADLSQVGLVKELGFPGKQSRLSGIEYGRNSPHPKKNEFDRAYIEWLKGKGYDPYKLE